MKQNLGMIFIALLLTLGIGSVWLMDVGEVIGSLGSMTTNGFWGNDPQQVYHIGMYLNVIVVFLLSVTGFYYRERYIRCTNGGA